MTIARTILPFVFALACVVLPVEVYGNSDQYTWGGQTFSSEAERDAFIEAYYRVYRELYGVPVSTSPQKNSSVRSRTQSQTSVRPERVSAFSVTTREARSTVPGEAVFTGTIDFKSRKTLSIWFEYGLGPTVLINRTEPELRDRAQFGSTRYDRNVRGLVDDTMYYYRAVAADTSGSVYRGSVRTFRSTGNPKNELATVDVTTDRAYEVDEDRANLLGRYRVETEAPATIWFRYSDEADDLYKVTRKISVTQTPKAQNHVAILRNLASSRVYYYQMVGEDVNGVRNFGVVRSFTTRADRAFELPRVQTFNSTVLSPYSAKLGGQVDINDINEGTVFFLYGEDYNDIAEVPQRYRRYKDVRTQGDQLQKVLLEDELEGYDTYEATVQNLDFDTVHYAAIAVAYEDFAGNDVIAIGKIVKFTTPDLKPGR